ncbi:lariat debranching enzyme-like [Bradysia coprophila]|uniref:lariat debranching enzyme-like n=1 Tax=Bradysia coprophila TaxID=38358 RepID=UPI00187D71FA|nr:lariat debranching enzyme-like [Bradysia coprophila]
MKVAIAGCIHGEVERMYKVLESIETEKDCRVDLLLCCGDFQAVRDEMDLESMTRTKDYHDLGTFHKYYNGESTAPVLTIFIGGNHEASNYLQELPFGGWVAPNIYYLGYAGCVNINGLRVGGISGIYKKYNYRRYHHEFPPYTEDSKRSVYHVRELEVFRLKQLSSKIDIFMSHDWPRNIDKFGDEMTPTDLISMNPNFESDIKNDCLGSPANKEILDHLQPSYWVAAHLHCRFSAEIQHGSSTKTKFLALDKAVHDAIERKFIEILDIDVEPEESPLSYDLEWLTVLHNTQHLVTGKTKFSSMPKENGPVRWNFTPTSEEKELILSKFDDDLIVPINFCRMGKSVLKGKPQSNPQTSKFCSTLNVDDPLCIAMAGIN